MIEYTVHNHFPVSPVGVEQKATKETKSHVRGFFVSFFAFCSKSSREVVSSQILGWTASCDWEIWTSDPHHPIPGNVIIENAFSEPPCLRGESLPSIVKHTQGVRRHREDSRSDAPFAILWDTSLHRSPARNPDANTSPVPVVRLPLDAGDPVPARATALSHAGLA